ncbi:Uncharacterized membrane protein YgdD, TMEM256/DUF423 family [Faunimonas pinastri]|uniref:Uncharacterized membrane protein YgdD, TMEM256/DUF423 family n=1 Tax=Faunimonas pinastri TaxID=1855383 RepID=A0A1H9QLC6_9HYPH|nr:DUF423 domain-containing protein [Faunimonas pinastri]SER60659.1 Uncharacterized membrane protein YgdD, TMEM256/DUF423 family [Faunimonas pinastri]
MTLSSSDTSAVSRPALSPWRRTLLALAALLGGAGVILGAVAAHKAGAEGLVTASSFLLFHATAIFALNAAPGRRRLLAAAQLAMLIGVILFAGTLTLHILGGIHLQPSPAPWGGTLMILGWVLAAIGIIAA